MPVTVIDYASSAAAAQASCADEGNAGLRIGLEVSPLAINATGIPNYIRRLLSGFAALDDDNEYLLYSNRPIPCDMELPQRFRTVIVDRPHPRFQLWFQIGLPGQLRRDGAEIFHGLFSRLPHFLPVPGVITVHDLSGLRMPGMHKRWTRMTNLLYPVYIRKARGIIAVSEATAEELRELFPQSSRKITVVHEAAPSHYSPVEDAAALSMVRERYGLPGRYILFLGTVEPRKNLTRLLSAFRSVADRVPHSLVIAGDPGWKNREFMDALGESGCGDRVRMTGFVDAAHIPALISMAEIFVYPSLYEGFGLPILEAMACGTPVITSNCSSMPEVAGDAGLLVDPLSVESIAAGILKLAEDGDLRTRMAGRGLLRSRGFSWEDSARKTLEVYRRVLAGDMGP